MLHGSIWTLPSEDNLFITGFSTVSNYFDHSSHRRWTYLTIFNAGMEEIDLWWQYICVTVYVLQFPVFIFSVIFLKVWYDNDPDYYPFFTSLFGNLNLRLVCPVQPSAVITLKVRCFRSWTQQWEFSAFSSLLSSHTWGSPSKADFYHFTESPAEPFLLLASMITHPRLTHSSTKGS